MYAYIDETGNTGANIFDKDQPVFMTAAFITRRNFDEELGHCIRSLAKNTGFSVLHANEIGAVGVEQLSVPLLRLFSKIKPRFVISIIEKEYLATCKLVDTIFDPGENLAVPWHVYNVRVLRLLLVFKVQNILTMDIVQKFWDALMSKNKDAAHVKLREVMEHLKACTHGLQDERSRQIVNQALEWALENIDAMYWHASSRSMRRGHLPNMVAFPVLLGGIDQFSQQLGKKIKEIVHDQQDEFKSVLQEWHKLISNAAPGKVRWPLDEPYSILRVPGSDFHMRSSSESTGLQVVDVVLWLLRRFRSGEELTGNSRELVEYVIENSLWSDLSFAVMRAWLEEEMLKAYSIPLTEDDIAKAKGTLNHFEELRQDKVKQFLNTMNAKAK